MESSENRILFKEDFSIKVNDDRNPLFYVFDYGVRSDAMNMEFQHFHDFYELFFLVDDHVSEGSSYRCIQNISKDVPYGTPGESVASPL